LRKKVSLFSQFLSINGPVFPERRSPRVSVLNEPLLRLRRKPLCDLASDQNLPFLNEHLVVLDSAILVRVARIRGWALANEGKRLF
jgi:hypothetical protein